MNGIRGVQIAGTGHYLPEKILTNQDLEKVVDTTDEWIRTMTGMKHRHVAAPEQATSDLCVEAAKKALEDANMTPDDIDLIIVGTLTPDMMFPATGPLVQNKLGCRKIPAFDYSIACSGYIYGLSIAKQFVACGTYNNVLVITGEILTRITDYTDRNTAVLFGDAASAAIVTPSEKNKFLGFSLGSDGSETDLLYQPAGGSKIPASHESIDQRLHYLKMEGPSIFRLAVN
ncbi:MAG: 3-oxoacyl-ACP synthase, partial [Spirochaetae bacterium HGW-Spirochaetae-6]